MLKQQHQLFVGLLAAVDAAVVIIACFIAWRIRYAVMPHEWWPQSWEQYPKEAVTLYMVPVMLLALRWFGLYRARRDRSLIGELSEIVKCSVAGVLVVVTLAVAFESNLLFSTKDSVAWKPITVGVMHLDAGRVQLGALMVILPIALGLERLCFRWGLRQLRRRGWNLRHVCIIGCGRLGQIVARTLERNTWTGLKVSYFVSHHDQARRAACADRPVMGGLADLEDILDKNKPDAVYIALPGKKAAMMYDVLGRLERFPVDVRVIPDINPRYVPQSMTVSELDGMPILSYRECPTSGLGGISKRGLDICGALAALVIFGVPMLIIAGVVRMGGPGPIMFRQRRVSLGGQVFDIFKFRTMYHAEDEAALRTDTDGTNAWTAE